MRIVFKSIILQRAVVANIRLCKHLLSVMLPSLLLVVVGADGGG
jgi:hypothetical protein